MATSVGGMSLRRRFIKVSGEGAQQFDALLVATGFLKEMENRIKNKITELTNKMKQDLVTRQSYRYSTSWQASKYSSSTAKYSKDKVSGRSYFIGTNSGNRFFKAFAEEQVRVNIKNDAGLKINVSIANFNHLQSKTKNEDGDPLFGIFVPKNKKDAGVRGNSPGNGIKGVYRIAFYDDILDEFKPLIRKELIALVKKMFIDFFIMLTRKKLKDVMRGTAGYNIAMHKALFGISTEEQKDLRLQRFGRSESS